MSTLRKTRKSLALPNGVELISAHRLHYPGADPSPISIYDDGWGRLYIHRDTMGISGIVRAQSWEYAYSICEDEFFTPGDEEAAEEWAAIEALPEGSEERRHLEACYEESFGYRSNGLGLPDGTTSYIYAKDLNGDSLDILTPALARELGIVLRFRENTTDDSRKVRELSLAE